MFCNSVSSFTRIVTGTVTGLPVPRALPLPAMLCGWPKAEELNRVKPTAAMESCNTIRWSRRSVFIEFPLWYGRHYTDVMKEALVTSPKGKLSGKDATTARLLKVAPWLAIAATSLPAPLVFLVLFLTATATDSAAVFLLLAGLSLTLGFALGLIIAALLFLYRKRWLSKLRDRLASDGITANEVVWFRSELTSAERASLAEIEQTNPLLADAYMETLANRLMASRGISRSKREMLRVERQINRARTLNTPESAALQKDLAADHERLEQLRQQATDHLAKAKTRLQTIEATARRSLTEGETDIMMQRLGNAQDQLPLVLEIAQIEQPALREATTESTK